MKHLKFLSPVLISLFVITSCKDSTVADVDTKSATAADSSTFDLSKATSVINENNAKFSEKFRNGDSAGLAAMYSSDALLMEPGADAVKKENILSAWGAAIKAGIKDIKLTTDDMVGNADLLVETGQYEIYGDKNQLIDKGKYVVTWKQENGEWKIYRDIYNTSRPAKASK